MSLPAHLRYGKFATAQRSEDFVMDFKYFLQFLSVCWCLIGWWKSCAWRPLSFSLDFKFLSELSCKTWLHIYGKKLQLRKVNKPSKITYFLVWVFSFLMFCSHSKAVITHHNIISLPRCVVKNLPQRIWQIQFLLPQTLIIKFSYPTVDCLK